jgi:hypothetical protein
MAMEVDFDFKHFVSKNEPNLSRHRSDGFEDF